MKMYLHPNDIIFEWIVNPLALYSESAKNGQWMTSYVPTLNDHEVLVSSQEVSTLDPGR